MGPGFDSDRENHYNEKFTAAVDKKTILSNKEARRLKTARTSFCKKVNAGQIAAHDVAVRIIGAELNSYVRGGG